METTFVLQSILAAALFITTSSTRAIEPLPKGQDKQERQNILHVAPELKLPSFVVKVDKTGGAQGQTTSLTEEDRAFLYPQNPNILTPQTVSSFCLVPEVRQSQTLEEISIQVLRPYKYAEVSKKQVVLTQVLKVKDIECYIDMQKLGTDDPEKMVLGWEKIQKQQPLLDIFKVFYPPQTKNFKIQYHYRNKKSKSEILPVSFKIKSSELTLTQNDPKGEKTLFSEKKVLEKPLSQDYTKLLREHTIRPSGYETGSHVLFLPDSYPKLDNFKDFVL